MAALCNRAGHIYFHHVVCSSSSFFLSSPNLRSRILDVYHTSTWCGFSANLECRSETSCTRLGWKCRTQKIAKKSPKSRRLRTIATNALIDNRKKMLSSHISSIRPHNMVNFGLLAAEIDPVVWGTPANFNGFRVLAALLHDSQVVSVSQTLRR